MDTGIMGLAMSYISTVIEDKSKRAISISNFRAICVFGVLPTSGLSFGARKVNDLKIAMASIVILITIFVHRRIVVMII
jgi:hypothetical protein